MVDQGTWNRLTLDQQSEYRSVHMAFTAAVQASKARDQFEFNGSYRVVEVDGAFEIASDGVSLPGVRVSDRAVADALRMDAVQNYGR